MNPFYKAKIPKVIVATDEVEEDGENFTIAGYIAGDLTEYMYHNSNHSAHIVICVLFGRITFLVMTNSKCQLLTEVKFNASLCI